MIISFSWQCDYFLHSCPEFIGGKKMNILTFVNLRTLRLVDDEDRSLSVGKFPRNFVED